MDDAKLKGSTGVGEWTCDVYGNYVTVAF